MLSRRSSVLRALRRQSWRRRLVLGAHLGYLAYLGSLALTYSPDLDAGFYGVRLPLAVLVAVCYYLLHRVTFESASRPDQELDEREIQVRAAAYRTAYRILALLLIPPVAYTLVALDYPVRLLAPLHSDLLSEVYILLVLMALTLPTTISAWTEPDPVEEPEDEEDFEGPFGGRTLRLHRAPVSGDFS